MIKRMLGVSVIALTAAVATGCGGDDNDEVRYIAAPDSESQEEQAYEALQAPGALSHRSIAGTDLLRWGTPSDTETASTAGFNVYMYDPDPERADAFVRYNSSPVGGGRLEMNDLNAGDTYWFQVAAVDADGVEGMRSASISFVAVGGVDDGRGDGLPTDQGGPTPYEGSPQQF